MEKIHMLLCRLSTVKLEIPGISDIHRSLSLFLPLLLPSKLIKILFQIEVFILILIKTDKHSRAISNLKILWDTRQPYRDRVLWDGIAMLLSWSVIMG